MVLFAFVVVVVFVLVFVVQCSAVQWSWVAEPSFKTWHITATPFCSPLSPRFDFNSRNKYFPGFIQGFVNSVKTCQIPCILTDLYPAVQVKYARKAVFAFISLIQPKKESQADRMKAKKQKQKRWCACFNMVFFPKAKMSRLKVQDIVCNLSKAVFLLESLVEENIKNKLFFEILVV